MKKKTMVVSRKGEACPRCKRATEIHAHRQITPKLLKQPYYYSRWYCCVNPNCRTTLIMPEKFKVFNQRAVGAEQQAAESRAETERARFGERPPWE
jgi:hypothetical protein